MKQIVVALLLALTVSACAGKEQATEREKFWVQAVAQFLSQPRKLDDLHGSLRQKEVIYTFDEKDVVSGRWRVPVEHVHVEGFFGTVWYIYMNVQVAPDGTLTD